MSTIQDMAVLRDGWAKIGQLSCVPHLGPAIGATRLAGARVAARLRPASVLRPIDVVSVLARSEETARHGREAHAPTRSPCVCVVAFSSSLLASKERFAKASRSRRAGRVCWPPQRFDCAMPPHVVCP
jgi:hypothetical protein